MAVGEKKSGRRRSRDTKRVRKRTPLPSTSRSGGREAADQRARLSQSSDNLDKFSVSGEVRSDRRSASSDAEKPRLPLVDGAVGRDREQLARKALAAFGGSSARGSSAASGQTAKRPGGRLVSRGGPGALGALAGAAKVGAKRGPIADDLTEPEDVGTDVLAEEASTDLDPEEAGSDVEREWADGEKTVRDSKPPPL